VKKVAIKQEPREEKIMMTLGADTKPKPAPVVEQKIQDVLAPTLVDEDAVVEIPMQFELEEKEEEEAQLPLQYFELSGAEKKKEEPKEEQPSPSLQLKFVKEENSAETEREKERKELEKQKQALEDKFEALRQNILGGGQKSTSQQNSPATPSAGGYLSRPSNIYAESQKENPASKPAEEPARKPILKSEPNEELDMQLVIRHDGNGNDVPAKQQAPTAQTNTNEQEQQATAGEDKQRAADRLQKLRNLSFNLNAADPNNEYENVPAYIRRNMDLQNGTSSVENFYSNYSVKSDGKNNATISTINTFLDGKKPD
jgi:cell division protein FtsZ